MKVKIAVYQAFGSQVWIFAEDKKTADLIKLYDYKYVGQVIGEILDSSIEIAYDEDCDCSILPDVGTIGTLGNGQFVKITKLL